MLARRAIGRLVHARLDVRRKRRLKEEPMRKRGEEEEKRRPFRPDGGVSKEGPEDDHGADDGRGDEEYSEGLLLFVPEGLPSHAQDSNLEYHGEAGENN